MPAADNTLPPEYEPQVCADKPVATQLQAPGFPDLRHHVEVLDIPNYLMRFCLARWFKFLHKIG